VDREARVLDRDALHAGAPHRPGQHAHRLRDAVGHHDALGLGGHAPRAAQIGGERDTQRARPGAVAVTERGHRRVAHRLAQRRRPRSPWERAEVGGLQAEVEAHRRRHALLGRLQRIVAGDGCHPRRSARPRHEEALRDELRVGLDDHAARDPELGGECPRARQRRARVQRAAADPVAQLILQLAAQRAVAALVDDHQQIESEALRARHPGETLTATDAPEVRHLVNEVETVRKPRYVPFVTTSLPHRRACRWPST
jgi:hypothetical protein